MNSSSIFNIVLKFVIIWVVQIVVLKQIQFVAIGPYNYEAFVYPLFILLLPAGMHINMRLLLAFGTGLIIDGAYNTLGVHIASALILAFSRNTILGLVFPRGVDENLIPSLKRLKFYPFLQYSSYALLLYLFSYYSMTLFSPVYLLAIVMKTLLSFVVSIIFTLILAGILNGLD